MYGSATGIRVLKVQPACNDPLHGHPFELTGVVREQVCPEALRKTPHGLQHQRVVLGNKFDKRQLSVIAEIADGLPDFGVGIEHLAQRCMGRIISFLGPFHQPLDTLHLKRRRAFVPTATP